MFIIIDFFYKMEVDIIFLIKKMKTLKGFKNGRPNQLFNILKNNLNFWTQWKTTSTFQKIGRQSEFFIKIEDDLSTKKKVNKFKIVVLIHDPILMGTFMRMILITFLFSLVQIKIQSLDRCFGPNLTLNLPSKNHHPPPKQAFLQERIVHGNSCVNLLNQ